MGYPLHEIDVSPMFDLRDFAGGALARENMAEGPGTVIFHFNPEALVVALLAAGRGALKGKRIIGYWAWETAHIPPSWAQALRFLDEIWTPSHFVAAAIKPFTTKPVRVVPHPVTVLPRGQARRADFGMGSEFTALTMASFHSTFDRKNPLAAIDAFRLAFGDDMRAQLIVKLSHGSQASADMMRGLQDHIAGAPNIRMLNKTMRGDEVRDLIASADVLLSLHRSEGFGLPMAEAMQAGTPVIATNWSGNVDFMDESCAGLVSAVPVPAIDSQGFFLDRREVWAEPSIGEAAAWLKRLAGDAALRAAMAERAQARVETELLEDFRRAVRAALLPLARAAPAKDANEIAGIALQFDQRAVAGDAVYPGFDGRRFGPADIVNTDN
jgi:glycosyltransferase involved in cell wall biosynthesis